MIATCAHRRQSISLSWEIFLLRLTILTTLYQDTIRRYCRDLLLIAYSIFRLSIRALSHVVSFATWCSASLQAPLIGALYRLLRAILGLLKRLVARLRGIESPDPALLTEFELPRESGTRLTSSDTEFDPLFPIVRELMASNHALMAEMKSIRLQLIHDRTWRFVTAWSISLFMANIMFATWETRSAIVSGSTAMTNSWIGSDAVTILTSLFAALATWIVVFVAQVPTRPEFYPKTRASLCVALNLLSTLIFVWAIIRLT